METEKLIELAKELQELKDISTTALVLATTACLFIFLWSAFKYITAQFDKE